MEQNVLSCHVSNCHIPLEANEVRRVIEAIELIKQHADQGISLPEDGEEVTYECALPTAPPRRDNPERAHLAEAIFRAMYYNAECDGCMTLKWMKAEPHVDYTGTTCGIDVFTHKGADGSVNAACALIQACQREFDAGPVGLSYVHMTNGVPDYEGLGAVVVVPGPPDDPLHSHERVEIEIHNWIEKQTDKAYGDSAAAEADSGPAAPAAA